MENFLAVLASVWKQVNDASVDAERIYLAGFLGISLFLPVTKTEPVLAAESDDFEQIDARRAHFRDYLDDQTGIDQYV